jgi:hypothetical protein
MDGSTLFDGPSRAGGPGVEREGLSRRQAAERFEIGIKTAIDWVRRFHETGRLAAPPMGGCRAEGDRRPAPRLAARALRRTLRRRRPAGLAAIERGSGPRQALIP